MGPTQGMNYSQSGANKRTGGGRQVRGRSPAGRPQTPEAPGQEGEGNLLVGKAAIDCRKTARLDRIHRKTRPQDAPWLTARNTLHFIGSSIRISIWKRKFNYVEKVPFLWQKSTIDWRLRLNIVIDLKNWFHPVAHWGNSQDMGYN